MVRSSLFKSRSLIFKSSSLVRISNAKQSSSLLSSTSDMRFTLISNKNDLCIGISSVYKYNNIIRNFIKLLRDTEIEMYINTEVI